MASRFRCSAAFFAIASLGLPSCSGRPPFVVLSIEDPSNAATGFATLHVGASRDSLAAVKLDTAAFPLAITVTGKKPGEKTLWVEARNADGLALARGATVAVFARVGTPTATIRLAKACVLNGECNEGLFCFGTSQCQYDMCVTVGLPCVSNFPCVQTTCVELGGGEGTCSVAADNSLCPAGSYCSATAGCLPNCGNGIIDAGETCDDGDTRDTGNGCDWSCQRNDVCGDGVPEILFEQCDDGDTDECNGCRSDCNRGCICLDAFACVGANWCSQGECTACDVPAHCGQSCVACPTTAPLCGGVDTGCVCDASPAPRGSCGHGTFCSGGTCLRCDVTDHCGQECLACSGDTPVCGGAEVGCVVNPATDPPSGGCLGKPDFTPCRVASPTRSYNICIDGMCVEPGCGDATCNARGASFAQADVVPDWEYPDTNQRTCYNATTTMTCTAFPCAAGGGPSFCGQDAQYGWDTMQPDPQARWTRTADDEPVVTDNITGLVWQGCPGGRNGPTCAGGGSYAYPWQEALTYCDGLVWGGYADWRLPDYYELSSIIDSSKYEPAIDGTAFPGTRARLFWSSTSYAGAASYAWRANLSDGYLYYTNKSTFFYDTRCVRAGPSSRAWSATPRLSRGEPVAGQPVVADGKTKLMWQGCTAGLSGSNCASGSSTSYSWQAALAYCEGLTWSGYADWRLPSRAELASIVDVSRYNPAIDAGAFPGTPVSWYWSSTSHPGYPNYAWLVDFIDGHVAFDVSVKSGTYRARCVRPGP